MAEAAKTAQRTDSIALINGIVHPMAGESCSSALFARGGIIKTLGSDKDILSMCDGKTIVLDMKGKAVLPGFTDTHNHLLATGRSLETLDLRGIRSIAAIIKESREYLLVSDLPEGEWFQARGWNQEHLAEKRYPNKNDLDKITKDIPMFFERSCGHIAALNSKAMELLHIGPGFKIAGGVVSTDENGEPTGVISEAVVSWVRMNIPGYSQETLERWYKNATDEMVRLGITSVQTDDLELTGSAEKIFGLYETMEDDKKMPLRIAQQWQLRDVAALESFIANGYSTRKGEYFKSGPLKVHVDGTLGARTAALREEYSDDPGNRGVYTHSQNELLKFLHIAQDAGMQVAFYAIGDGAIERCLNVIEKSQPAPKHLKHRIVHCQVGAEDLYERMARLGVMADIQPAFVTSDWPIVLPRLGAERARLSYSWKLLSQFGIKTGAGSDAPAEPLNPFNGIRAAIMRQDMSGKPEHGWMPSQRLTAEEAFSLCTKGSAEVCGEGEVLGTLEPGKAADMVAYTNDPFSLKPDEMLDIEVGLTVVDGRISYIR